MDSEQAVVMYGLDVRVPAHKTVAEIIDTLREPYCEPLGDAWEVIADGDDGREIARRWIAIIEANIQLSIPVAESTVTE